LPNIAFSGLITEKFFEMFLLSILHYLHFSPFKYLEAEAIKAFFFLGLSSTNWRKWGVESIGHPIDQWIA
jgi:hypothetical protein